MSLRWTRLFSEGGPFVAAEETAFRRWPGSAGWSDALQDLEAPGAVSSRDGGTLCFFDPEDPGPIDVGWNDGRLVMVRWSEQGAPVPEIGPRAEMVAQALAGEHEELEELGEITLHDGLVLVSWAAIAGSDLDQSRDQLERIADDGSTLRFDDGGPALTVARLQPGRYRVTGVFDYFDEEHERGGTWVQIEPA